MDVVEGDAREEGEFEGVVSCEGEEGGEKVVEVDRDRVGLLKGDTEAVEEG